MVMVVEEKDQMKGGRKSLFEDGVVDIILSRQWLLGDTDGRLGGSKGKVKLEEEEFKYI